MAGRPHRSLLAALGLGGIVLLLAACGETSPQLRTGDPAPGYTTRYLDGTSLDFPEAYRNRVVALRFWADWCRFCREEMKAVESVYQRHRAAGLAVLAVNVGQSQAVAEGFVRGIGVSYDVALDPDATVARRYGVSALPVTYFVDRQGRVRDKILGEASADVFERIATALLDERP